LVEEMKTEENKPNEISSTGIEKPKAQFVNYYDSSEFSVNERWYYLPILDLTTCSNFQADVDWIAKRLGISTEETHSAIVRLESEGLLSSENGTWKKVKNHLVIPTVSSREKVRQYHKTMSLRAIEVMETNILPKDFQKRLIKGSTFAVNPLQLEQAKEIIEKALVDVIETLTAGDCTELYHFNLQLFPLLKQEEDK
jgi:uncharacterized protein (TIGR02147 family)